MPICCLVRDVEVTLETRIGDGWSAIVVFPPHQVNFTDIYKAFNRYKLTIPVYGAILLDCEYQYPGKEVPW